MLHTLQVGAFWALPDRLAEMAGETLQTLCAALERNPIHTLGPGFWYRRHREGLMSMWVFRIWGQVELFAIANRGDEIALPGEGRDVRYSP